MDVKGAAQVIRDTVSMRTVLDLYGLSAKRDGFMVCPFHGDHDASLKIYPGTGGWHCFGCGKGGSVIDFVMEWEGCGFSTAVKGLDRALELHLIGGEQPDEAMHRRRQERVLDDLTELLLKEIDDAESMIEISIRIMTRESMEISGKPKKDRSADEWTRLYWLDDEMQFREDKKRQCDQLREEVQTWRRDKRRQMARARGPASSQGSRRSRSSPR